MHINTWIASSLVTALAALAPTGVTAVESTPAVVSVSAVPGVAGVRISGTITGKRQLRALVYATLAPDLPVVLLSRSQFVADSGGHFDTTLPIAPAYFRDETITVAVQTATGVTLGRGSVVIVSPNVPDPIR